MDPEPAASRHAADRAAVRAARPVEPDIDAEVARRRDAANPLGSASPGVSNPASTLRRQILYSLRTDGGAPPEQIAERVGASRTGVLQQLRTLEAAGLVTRTIVRHGVGRPRHLYDLTAGAQDLFPANYLGLAQSMLRGVESIGGDDLVDAVFQARREQLKERLSRRIAQHFPQGGSLWDRVREVATFQDESGYLGRATRDADGTIRLSEHNCAIHDVSGQYHQACAAELQLFGEVLDANVSRECHIVAGGRSCTYRIEPKG